MKDDYIKYRIERANNTLDDAILLFEKGSLGSAINRMYYSAFYPTIALLLEKDMEVKSHNGVKNNVGKLVLEGELDKQHAVTFGILSNLRHKGDYDDLFDLDAKTVEQLIEPVKCFISDIEKLLST